MDPSAENLPTNPVRRRFAFWRRIPRTFTWCFVSFALGAAAAAGVFYWSARPKHGDDLRTTGFAIYQAHDPARQEWIDHHDTVEAIDSMFAAEPARKVASIGERVPLTLRRGRSAGVAESPEIQIGRDDLGFAWSEGGDAYRIYGDFDALLRALPAVRCGQLLQSLRADERSEGLQTRQAQGDELFDALLTLGRSNNQHLTYLAMRNLDELVRERPPFRRAAGTWRRFSTTAGRRAAEIRQAAVAAIERMIASPPPRDDRLWWKIGATCRLLGETGDVGTADEISRLLAVEVHFHLTDELMSALEAIHGLPPSYIHVTGCGNITEAEAQKRATANTALRIPARDQLLKWHAVNRSKDREARHDAVLDLWHSRLTTAVANDNARFGFLGFADPLRKLAQFGPELAPALKRRQAKAADDLERAVWEYVAALVTDDCDAELVERLLAGDLKSQAAACRIIAASGKSKWPAARLARLLHVPTHDPKVPRNPQHVSALHEAASFALLACYGPAAVLHLEQAKERSLTAGEAIRFYRPTSGSTY